MNSLLRPARFLRKSLITTTTGHISTPLSYRRCLAYTLVRRSTSGYGDADQTGDDPSNKPNLQGPRPRIDTEHPGREPVDEGKGTGSGGYAETGEKGDGAGGGGKSDLVAQQKGEDQGGESGVGSGRRLVSDMEGAMPDEGEKVDVERHNREMDERYGHVHGGEKDEKVEKGFWSGESSGSRSSQ